MSTRSRLVIAGAAGLLLTASAAVAAPLPVLSATDALIQNSGSTNTLGYMVYVSPDGHVRYAEMPRQFSNPPGVKFEQDSIPKGQAKKLFQDIAAAMPLTGLPVRHGMRSASFGTQTTLTYKGMHSSVYQHSPDLTFASDSRTAALKADIDNITKTLHVGNAPRRPIVIHADR